MLKNAKAEVMGPQKLERNFYRNLQLVKDFRGHETHFLAYLLETRSQKGGMISCFTKMRSYLLLTQSNVHKLPHPKLVRTVLICTPTEVVACSKTFEKHQNFYPLEETGIKQIEYFAKNIFLSAI